MRKRSPIPADPKAKDEAARQVLRAGVEHAPERAPGCRQGRPRPNPIGPMTVPDNTRSTRGGRMRVDRDIRRLPRAD
jgi:hypothetical protein